MQRGRSLNRWSAFTAHVCPFLGAAACFTVGRLSTANAQEAPKLREPSASLTASTAQSPALVITVITAEAEVPTFRERVSSWFSDGTRVRVAVASELRADHLFAPPPQEANVWVVLPSPERALVLFSLRERGEPARYLLREVRLISGLDELGLERLASVIHSATLALREGVEGFERPHVEKELVLAGILPNSAPDQPLAASQQPTIAVPPAAPPKAPTRASSDLPKTANTPRASAFLLTGYVTRLRGAEGLGHGPLLGAGVRTVSGLQAQVSATWLLKSQFDVGGIAASIRTTALRAHVGLWSSLVSQVELQALLGGGVDWAQIDAQRADMAISELRTRGSGSQWLGALELTLGVWWRSRWLDWGATASTTFLLGDVHYSLASSGVEQRLAAPWPIQPGLSFQVRLRSGP